VSLVENLPSLVDEFPDHCAAYLYQSATCFSFCSEEGMDGGTKRSDKLVGQILTQNVGDDPVAQPLHHFPISLELPHGIFFPLLCIIRPFHQ